MFRFFGSRDEQLVRRARDGRRDAFDALVRRHLPAVRAVAYARTGNFADAEDVSQETFLRALQGLDGLREAGRIGAWLIAIARNVSSQLVTTRAKERAAASEAPSPTATHPEMERRELRAIVRKRLEELDATSREIILLHYFAGEKVKDVAALLEISEEAARKRLQRARESLSELLLTDLRDDATPFRSVNPAMLLALAAVPLPSKAAAQSVATNATSWGFNLVGAIMAKKIGLLVAAVIAFVLAIYVPKAFHSNGSRPPDSRPMSKQNSPGLAANSAELTASQPTNGPIPEVLPAGETTLSGFVFDPHDRPVVGASVTFADYGVAEESGVRPHVSQTVTTGSDGAFRFTGLVPSSRVMVRAEKAGMILPTTRSNGILIMQGYSYSLPAKGRADAIVRLWPSGTIRGFVTNQRGERLAGEDVTAKLIDYNVPIVEAEPKTVLGKLFPFTRKKPEFSPTTSTKTDSHGAFELAGLLPGTHVLVIAAEERIGELKDGEVELNEGAIVEGVHLTLAGDDTLGISGSVLDEEGNPIKGAFVQASGSAPVSATTDAGGAYRLTRMKEGTYDLHVTHDRYQHAARREVAAGSESVDFVLTANAAGISGIVVEASSGSPVQDFEIQVIEGSVGAISPMMYGQFGPKHDPKGRFSLANSPSGTATVVVRAPHFAMAFKQIEAEPGRPLENVVVELARGAVVEGRTEATDGKPVGRVFVFSGRFESPPTHGAGAKLEEQLSKIAIAQSDSEGRFVIDSLDFGTQLLSAYSTSGMRGSATVEVTGPPQTPVTLVLSAEGSVRGHVVANGAPLADIQIIATQPGGAGTLARTKSAADGSFVLSGLATGDAGVVALMPVEGSEVLQRQLIPVVVRSDGAEEVQFDLTPGNGVVEGKVTVLGAAPHEGQVRLNLELPAGGSEERMLRLAADGNFRIEGVPAGAGFLLVDVRTPPAGSRCKSIAIMCNGADTIHQDIDLSGNAVVNGHVVGKRPNEQGTVIALDGVREVTEFGSATIAAMSQFVRGTALIGDDGTYRIEGLEPGTYTILAIATLSRSIEGLDKVRITTSVVEVTGNEEFAVNLVLP